MGNRNVQMGWMVVLSMLTISCTQDVTFSPANDADAPFSLESFLWKTDTQKVDVLFVIDNSPSMRQEQKKLADRIGAFTENLADVDWQLGITTTDVSSGRYGLQGELLVLKGHGEQILSHQDPNHHEIFANNIRRKESENCGFKCPSSSEEPLKATMLAIEKRYTSNHGFFRSGSNLAVIVISDEDEKSSGPSHATKPFEVTDSLLRNFGRRKAMTVYGIVIRPGDRSCFEQQDSQSSAHYGEHVTELAQITGGIVGSLCDEDYGKNLQNIGADTRDKLNSVTLKYEPVVTSLQIEFYPDHQTEMELDGRILKFLNPPPNHTRIEVFYEKKRR